VTSAHHPPHLTKRANPSEGPPDNPSSSPTDDTASDDPASQPPRKTRKTKKQQKAATAQPPNPADPAADADAAAAATPSAAAARRKPGRSAGGGALPAAAAAAERQRQHVRTYQRNLALRSASRDAAERARAQRTLDKMKASKGRTARIVAQHYTRARAAAALQHSDDDDAGGGVSEWAMWQRLAQCKREYHAAVAKLKQLDAAMRERGLGGGGGGGSGDSGSGTGGGGGGGSGGDGGGAGKARGKSAGEATTTDAHDLAALGAQALAEHHAAWTRRWVRGKQCMRMLYVVGQEVARRAGALGEPGAPPAPAWAALRHAWPRIERRWDELGDDEGRLDDIMAGVAREWPQQQQPQPRRSVSGGDATAGASRGADDMTGGSEGGGGGADGKGKGKRKGSKGKGTTRLFGQGADEAVTDAASGFAAAAGVALQRTRDGVAAMTRRLGDMAKDAVPEVQDLLTPMGRPSLYLSSPGRRPPIMPQMGGPVIRIH
jgi:hypothetical protein